MSLMVLSDGWLICGWQWASSTWCLDRPTEKESHPRNRLDDKMMINGLPQILTGRSGTIITVTGGKGLNNDRCVFKALRTNSLRREGFVSRMSRIPDQVLYFFLNRILYPHCTEHYLLFSPFIPDATVLAYLMTYCPCLYTIVDAWDKATQRRNTTTMKDSMHALSSRRRRRRRRRRWLRSWRRR